ncbi:MAG: hypothetical protein AB1679_12470 [Actinomycetota bacterium]
MPTSLSVTHFVRLPPETGTAALHEMVARLRVGHHGRKAGLWEIRTPSGYLRLSAPRLPAVPPCRGTALREAAGVLRPGRYRRPLRADLEVFSYHDVWLRIGLRLRTRWLRPRLSHLRAAREVLCALERAMEGWLEAWLVDVDRELAAA